MMKESETTLLALPFNCLPFTGYSFACMDARRGKCPLITSNAHGTLEVQRIKKGLTDQRDLHRFVYKLQASIIQAVGVDGI